jgi:hypothetical protein
MAKVKIQGNASGTGVLTVTAPNTSTDRTITLPDDTGTLISSTHTGDLTLDVSGDIILDADGGDIFLKDGGTQFGTLRQENGDLTIGTGDTGIRFHDGDNSIYTVNATTGAKLDGAVDLGEAAGRYKDLYLSGGLKVGGTGASNTLDDYEEGTWSPSFGADNQGFTIGSTAASIGKYIKIGSLVYFQMYLNITGSTPTSQGYRISGLPFTSNTSTYAFFSIGGTYSGTNADAIHDKAQWRLDQNGTTFRFYIASENANKDGNQAWGGSNTEYAFHVSGTYMITI